MKIKLHASLIAFATALCALSSFSQAQVGTQLAVPNSPAYENAANRLRSAPPRQYNFSKAVLGDIMRLMAEDAGISFFGLPEGATGADRIVTFSITASPFTALETLSKANGISLIFENDIWYLRPADDTELVGRIYEINYNSQELVRKNDQGGGSLGGSSGGSSSGGSGASSIGLSLQGSPDFFVTEPSRLLDDIRGILDLQTRGTSATFAPTASVDNVNQFALSGLQGQPDVVVRTPNGEVAGGGEGADSQAKVIWNSDSNSLYVVATRQQHQWIEGYLAAADQPQPLIAVEVKFIEMNKDPSRELGIDWTGVLGSGYGAGLSGPADGQTDPIESLVNLDRIADYTLPTAVLSKEALNLRLRALFNDRRSRTVSYPRMVTLDNREVSFRSVINQPVLSSNSSASLGAGATTTSAVEYVPIGTVINILPKRMAGNKLLLNVSVTVSDIVGTEVIDGNPFPIATSRVYTAPINVESGYTVAISGLDRATTSESATGVPVLGRIPILGYAFKNKGRERSRQHLMMLITPVVLNAHDPGVTKKPMTRDPWKNMPMVETHPAGGIQPVSHPAEDHVGHGKASIVARPVAPETTSTPDPATIANAKERKGLRIFGRRDDAPEPEAAPLVLPGLKDADVMEITTGADQNGTRTLTMTPVETGGSKPIAGPPAPKKAPVEAFGPKITSADSTAARQILNGANKVSADLATVPGGEGRLSPDDGQLVRNAYGESRKLLNEIEQLRDSKDVPLQGDLSDAWWKLVAVKSKAVKLSMRSPESLAINTSEEEEVED
ncbi:MAG: type II and III secretion system protein [Verrucomicrobiales bacterium]|nr:type II and III secretion system protein [Verrucomicrobiales bacterium]